MVALILVNLADSQIQGGSSGRRGELERGAGLGLKDGKPPTSPPRSLGLRRTDEGRRGYPTGPGNIWASNVPLRLEQRSSAGGGQCHHILEPRSRTRFAGSGRRGTLDWTTSAKELLGS